MTQQSSGLQTFTGPRGILFTVTATNTTGFLVSIALFQISFVKIDSPAVSNVVQDLGNNGIQVEGAESIAIVFPHDPRHTRRWCLYYPYVCGCLCVLDVLVRYIK